MRSMRTNGISLRASLVAALALGATAVPTAAWASAHGPKYFLNVSEGETTLPEYESVA